MMKKALLTGIIIIAASSLSYAMDCSNLTGCRKKICELQLKAASLTEPHARARVEAAIAELQANCTESTLSDHEARKSEKHTMKVNHKIEEAQSDIKEYEYKKNKALAEGKKDKALKYQHKIEEKQLKIKHLEGGK